MSIIAHNPQLVMDVVECSLKGSEYGTDAWKILRRCLLEERDPTSEELVRLDELVDRAKDDIEGPGLRVDLNLGRIY